MKSTLFSFPIFIQKSKQMYLAKAPFPEFPSSLLWELAQDSSSRVAKQMSLPFSSKLHNCSNKNVRVYTDLSPDTEKCNFWSRSYQLTLQIGCVFMTLRWISHGQLRVRNDNREQVPIKHRKSQQSWPTKHKNPILFSRDNENILKKCKLNSVWTTRNGKTNRKSSTKIRDCWLLRVNKSCFETIH